MQVSYDVAQDAGSEAKGDCAESTADLEGGCSSNLSSRLAAVQEADELIDVLSILIDLADSQLDEFRTRNDHGKLHSQI